MSEDGDDPSPIRPKRKIKRVMVLSSASSSDSEDSVGATQTRKKRLRVVSDEESSDSSGSSVVRAGCRRGKALPRVQSDSEGSACERPAAARAEGFASDSSEGNSDKCSICLLRFKDQEVGTPQSCEHIFCLDCITEWSKNVNTCPVDRISFDSIVVRSRVGGRVIRTDAVVVATRRPSTGSSIDILEIEDPTVCEVCGGSNDEETMLLCDGCDLGYHMQCLSPPLTEVPIDHWFCPNCDDGSVSNLRDIEDMIYLSEVDDLLSLVDFDMPLGPRRVPLRESRSVRRSQRTQQSVEQPSTSGGRTHTSAAPGSSRPPRASTNTTRRRRTTTTQRRKRRRNTTKTVIIEYEVQENGKFPVTKRVKKKLKKRKSRARRPRTAARRTHVRASVRAQLAAMKRQEQHELSSASPGVQALAAMRSRAGIPSLSIFGNSDQLDYFSEEDFETSEGATSEGATTAVAPVRRTSAIISAYRQARRKMISIPSPPQASAAPDLLSDILDSQALLHSKKSVVSVSVDGQVNIKLQKTEPRISKKDDDVLKSKDKVDLSKGEDTSKKAPSYPGQSGQGRGWGGGYQGSYPRDSAPHRGANYDNYQTNNNYQNRQGNNNYPQNNARREDFDSYSNFQRRPHQYSPYDDNQYDRNRRPNPSENNQNRNFNNNQRGEPGRHSLGPSWQPYAGSRQDAPHAPNRHSFGGFENPVDMRMGQVPLQGAANNIGDTYRSVDSQNDKPPSQPPSAFQPMSEPPTFKFDKISEIEKSEDEKSDSGLVIDTEKYDPTEPTIDEDSGEEGKTAGNVDPKPPEVEPIKQPEMTPPAVQNVLAGIDTSSLNVPPNVLDNAVRQVLQEHRNLITPAVHTNDKSDDDSDGDCPNFSIYSATSVHIANTAAGGGLAEVPRPVVQLIQHTDNLEDLVQEDDDAPMEPSLNAKEKTPEKYQPNSNISSSKSNSNNIIKQNVDQVYKERVSKRCPITTNTRNPIKIKLNTPSLIKRVSLYDEEDAEVEQEIVEKSEPVPEEKSEALRSPQTPLLDDNDCVSPTQNTQYQDNANDENQQDQQNDAFDSERKSTSPHKLSPSKIEAEEKNYEEDEDDDDKDLDKYKLDEPFDTEKGSDEENDVLSDSELDVNLEKSKKEDHERYDDNIEKMTESISETEDERSYTPCLDENKSKDTSLDTDKDKGIEGLDTEMISEEEGNDIFSDNDLRASPSLLPAHEEAADKKKDKSVEKEIKKRKKKESKKDGKEKKSKTRKNEVTFKKLSKSGKERNYRERDKDDKGKRRRDSSEGERERRKRKEKRKDLERYDVRNVVGDKRKSKKDPFGRDISPRRSPSPPSPRRRSTSKQRVSLTRARRSASRPRRSLSRPRRSLSRPRRSTSRTRRSPSRSRRSLSRSRGSPIRPRRSLSKAKRSASRNRRSISRVRRSISRARRSISRAKRVKSRSISRPKRATSGARKSPIRTRRSASPAMRRSASPAPIPARRRRRSADRVRKRRRSAEAKQKAPKKKKRDSPRRKSPKRKKAKRRSSSPSPSAAPAPRAWSAASLESHLLSPRTPPPPRRHKRAPPAPSKEVFTSGDNILVSVSFAEQPAPEPERRRRRREKRPRPARAAAAAAAAAKPVAIIDLDRSPFRELTPSPKNVIVLSDSEHGETAAEAEAAAPERGAVGPKTPPEPGEGAAGEALAEGAPEPRAPSPDAYDPFEPTRSPSASPSPSPPPPADDAPPSPPRLAMTLEAAQKTNMSADEVLDRRPLSPIEKVMALLQSTRDVSPEPPPSVQGAPAAGGVAPPGPPAAPGPPLAAQAPRVVLPESTRALPPKLFLAKPSPIKSNPVKPMQATKISKLPLPPARRDACSDLGGDSPYSPGSSDFADLFEPRSTGGKRDNTFDSLFGAKPNKRKDKNSAGKVKLGKKKGNKTQVGVKIDDDNLKIMEELPSSAVEMQVKSKFLKKLNRQERVVEEVKHVLKPHYNKKHVTKDEYKDILRRTVPKICHNKTGEINPSKIQALVEAYVKKFRKKHKLGIV